MFFILAVLYLSQGHIQAAPLISSQSGPPPSSSTSPVHSICQNQRSIWDIIWSCLATIFACSWVSVHPNIPGPGESHWKVGLRRLELMFWTILAPEMIILWAMRQWFGARNLERLYRRKEWTKTHGYFIQMGGFMLYKGDQPQGILSPEKLRDLHERGDIDFPTITEEEIKDRSKADGFAKTFVIAQTTWFIAQCLARGIRGLVLTQLELITLAFAFLNGFMYFLWWNKPMDVQYPVPVYLLEVPKVRERITETRATPTPTISENTFIQFKTYILATAGPVICTFIGARLWISKLVNEVGVVCILHTILIFCPVQGIHFLYHRVYDMFESPSTTSIQNGQMRVATFYAANTTDPEWMLCQAFMASTAVAFGAIHCLGWYFEFPSQPEELIWRIASAIITGVPLLLLITNIFDRAHTIASRNTISRRIYSAVQLTLGVPLFLLGLPLYIISRIFFLIEAFIALRALPPGAHAVVNWTPFIPHI